MLKRNEFVEIYYLCLVKTETEMKRWGFYKQKKVGSEHIYTSAIFINGTPVKEYAEMQDITNEVEWTLGSSGFIETVKFKEIALNE